MKRYQQLIILGDETIEGNKKKEKQKEKEIEKAEKPRKTSKLPLLNTVKEEQPKKIQKTKTSEKLIHDLKERK